MNDLTKNDAATTIREVIDAANFRRHDAEVYEIGDDLSLSVRGIEDDTATNGTTVKELLRLCRICGLTFEDGVRGEAITHGGTFACIQIKGVSLADIILRIDADKGL